MWFIPVLAADNEATVVPDTTAPVVTITVPTAAATFAASGSGATGTLALAGTASDAETGVASVSWGTNGPGAPSGAATGTTTWSVPAISLQPGETVITISARDGATPQNIGTDVLTVTYTQTTDTTDPVVTITSPSTLPAFAVASALLNLGGTATDNVGVTAVTWVNAQGGSGTASGFGAWSITGIVLQPGDNVITVTAVDAAANEGTDVVTVTYNATPPGLILTSVQPVTTVRPVATVSPVSTD